MESSTYSTVLEVEALLQVGDLFIPFCREFHRNDCSKTNFIMVRQNRCQQDAQSDSESDEEGHGNQDHPAVDDREENAMMKVSQLPC